jgi:5-methylcytosine-specific restriction protein A
MKAPTTTEAALKHAMIDFDQRLRHSRRWSNWEQNKAHKFAIREGSRLYPVKCILSIATGVPVSEFSGGEDPGQACAAVRSAGAHIVIVKLPDRDS